MVIDSKNLPYDGSNEFNGIIKYFRDETKNSDPSNAGLITLSSSCSSDPHNIFVDESNGTQGYWLCHGIGSWIQLGFLKEAELQLQDTHCIAMTGTFSMNGK